MVQCPSPPFHARCQSLYAALIATLLLAAPMAAAEKGAGDRPVIPEANCALLDDPRIAGRMDGLLEFLAEYCGREAEFLGGVASGEGYEGDRNFEPAAADIAVSNPAQDTSGTAKTQSETSIAFNPTTGTLCASWNDSFHGITQGDGFSGFGRSTDGGATWTDFGAVNPTVNFDDGDPSLVWRKVDGKFYYAALKDGGLGIYRSDDDCQSFTFVATVATGNDDKEILAVDNNPSSPYYGRLYVVWTDFGADIRIYSTYSTNAGATWSAQTALSAAGLDVQGAWPAVAPNGDVFVTWVTWLDPSGYPTGNIEATVARSTNGGTSYTLVTPPMTNKTNPRDSSATSNCGRPALGGNIRYLPSPTIAVDSTGALHIVYSYDPDAFDSGDESNVYYRKSTDNGATWQTEVLINDDGGTSDQWQPSLSVGVGNVVTVGYYSRQNDAGANNLFDYYSRTSFNAGATWQPSVRLTDASSSVVLDANLSTCYHGDYDTQTHADGFAHYLWSDDRGSTPDIKTEKTPAGTDFLPISLQASQTVCAPNDGVYTIDVLKFQTFAETVTLSATGNPAGTSVGFSANVQVPPFSSTLTVDVTGAASAGTSNITVSGTSNPGGIVHSTSVGLTIYTASPAAPTLSAPADGAIDQPRGVTLSWAPVADTVDYTVEVATDPGFGSIIRTQTVAGTSWAVNPQLGIETVHYWRVRANNSCGQNTSGAFSFGTANPSILLVDDDDNSPNVLSNYQTPLNSVAVYDIWDTGAGEPTFNDLKPYRAVIWFSGDRFCSATTPCTGPQTAAETALGQYLDGGRCLLIAAQDYLWDMGGSGHNTPTPFMANYLGLASGTSDTGDYTRVDGQNVYSALADLTLTYPYIDYSDILVLGAGAQEAFRGDTGSTKLGAISKLGASYFTTFMSFGVEALSADNQTAVLNQFLATCNSQVPLFTDNFELGNTTRWTSTTPP